MAEIARLAAAGVSKAGTICIDEWCEQEHLYGADVDGERHDQLNRYL